MDSCLISKRASRSDLIASSAKMCVSKIATVELNAFMILSLYSYVRIDGSINHLGARAAARLFAVGGRPLARHHSRRRRGRTQERSDQLSRLVHRRRDTSNRLRRLRSLSRAGGAPVFVPRAPPEPRTRSREFASAAPSTGSMPSRRRCTRTHPTTLSGCK